MDDVEAVRTVQEAAFARPDEPPRATTDEVLQRQRRRIHHFLEHDPAGSWVAELQGQVVGVALALRRAHLWGLSLLVVDPQVQSRGIGRLLMDAALRSAEGTQSA